MLNYQRVNNGTWLYLSQSNVKIRWDVCYRSDLWRAWPAAFFSTCDPKNQLIFEETFSVWRRLRKASSTLFKCAVVLSDASSGL